MKRFAVLFSLLTLSITATAQNLPVENELLAEEPVVRRYTVELVVFAYTEDISTGTELFIADEPVVEKDELLANDIDDPAAEDSLTSGEDPLADDSVGSNDDDALTDPETEEDLERELPYILLLEEEHTLVDVIERFELLDAYETLFHVAWTQPTYPAEDALPIELHALGEVPEGLNGSITLYLSRYLHLVIDLALDADEEPGYAFEEAVEPAFSFGDPRPQDGIYGYDVNGDASREIVRYRLQENRILKNGEMRYFDHPKFGVLAKVTRIEEEEEPEQEEEEEDSYKESRQLLSRLGQ